MPFSLHFQLPILVYLLFLSFFFPNASANYFHVDVVSELIDPLYLDCIMNGNIIVQRVGLKQSNVHRYEVEIATGQLIPSLLCNMTAGPRYGTFLIFEFKRDLPRCEIDHKRCTWNIMQDGLYLFFNNQQNRVFNWSMSPISYKVDVVNKLVDPLYIVDCKMNGVAIPNVGLQQLNLHRYIVPVNNTGVNVPNLFCNMTGGPRFGTFILFDLKRDEKRCEEDLRCIWNLMPDGLYIFSNNQQNLMFNWSSLPPIEYKVDVVNEIPDTLYVDCKMSDDVFFPRVELKQSKLQRYTVPINNTGRSVTKLVCKMTTGPNYGIFDLFNSSIDEQRCAEYMKCTWNVRPDGLYLYFNNSINRVYEWP